MKFSYIDVVHPFDSKKWNIEKNGGNFPLMFVSKEKQRNFTIHSNLFLPMHKEQGKGYKLHNNDEILSLAFVSP